MSEKYDPLTIGGTLDYGLDVTRYLECDESLDDAKIDVTAADPASLTITGVTSMTEGCVGRTQFTNAKVIAWRATAIGVTEGDQLVRIKAVGDGGTDQTFERIIPIVTYL